MKNRKINIDRKPLSSEEITKGMDFNGLMQQYSAVAKPWYKQAWVATTTKVTGVAFLATAVAVIIFKDDIWPDESNNVLPNAPIAEVQNGSHEAADAAFVKSPLSEVDLASSTFILDAALGAELVYMTGSVISIPANAFLNEEGKTIDGKVELHYTEYHDAADFLASGVRMEYDSAGKKYAFDSAGMLNIEAFQNGKPVFANPDNLIQVAIASKHDGEHYNLYYLDTTNRNWAFQGKDEVFNASPEEYETELLLSNLIKMQTRYNNHNSVVNQYTTENPHKALRDEIATMELDLRHLEEQTAVVEKDQPLKPARFDIDVLESEFPEFASFKNVQFELGLEAENNDFNLSDYEVEWENIDLKENEKGVNYILTLSKGNQSKTFIVYPVDDETQTEALKVFDAKFKAYQSKKAELLSQSAVLIEKIAVKRAQLNDEMSSVLELQDLRTPSDERVNKLEASRDKWKKSANQREKLHAKVTRSFNIAKFGFWNCDSPEPMPEGRVLTLKLLDAQGKKLDVVSVYHIDRSMNGLIHYFEVGLERFNYNPKKKNILFAITADGKMALLNEAGFEALKSNTSQTAEVKMELREEKFTTVKEIRKYLEI